MKNRLLKFGLLFIVSIIGGIPALFAAQYAAYNYYGYNQNASCSRGNYNRFYVGAGGSIDWHHRTELKSAEYKECYNFNPGANGSIFTGVIHNYWRADIEGVWLYSGVNRARIHRSATPIGKAKASPDGSIQNRAVMVNVYYDIPVDEGENNFSVYGGLGIGLSSNKFWVDSFSRTINGVSINFHKISETNMVFAWQVKAGLAYNCSEEIELFLGYRFFGTTLPSSFTRNLTGATTVSVSRSGVQFFHSIDLGVRVKI